MKRKIISLVVTAATATTMMAAPAMAAENTSSQNESVEKGSAELSLTTTGSAAAGSAVLSNPTGVITNLGSAAVENPEGSLKMATNNGSFALTHPATGAGVALSVAAPSIASKENAEKTLNKYKNQELSVAPTSDGQTTADKAILGLAFVGLILAALSATGLAPQLMAGLNLPALPMR